MSLRQVASGVFPYLESSIVRQESPVIVRYEFERTVFVHGFSINSDADISVEVLVNYPISFSSAQEAFPVQCANVVSLAGVGTYLSPFAVTTVPTGVSSPLPSVLPKGSVFEVRISTTVSAVNVVVQSCLIASGEY